jgi:hypothetical protein
MIAFPGAEALGHKSSIVVCRNTVWWTSVKTPYIKPSRATCRPPLTANIERVQR